VTRYAEPMARLIEELKKLPGVGTKSAQRYAFHILRSSDDDATALAEAVRGVKASLRLCSVCNNITDIDPCAYCASPTRNQRLICVVEEPTNIEAVERTRGYNGVYHVLHGTLSPLHEKIFKLAESEAAADNNRFIYRNFAGGTLETDGDHGA